MKLLKAVFSSNKLVRSTRLLDVSASYSGGIWSFIETSFQSLINSPLVSHQSFRANHIERFCSIEPCLVNSVYWQLRLLKRTRVRKFIEKLFLSLILSSNEFISWIRRRRSAVTAINGFLWLLQSGVRSHLLRTPPRGLKRAHPMIFSSWDALRRFLFLVRISGRKSLHWSLYAVSMLTMRWLNIFTEHPITTRL